MNTLDALHGLELDKEILVLMADRDGIIISANNKLRKATGYRLEELIGRPHSLLIHPEIMETVVEDLHMTLLNGNHWEGFLKRLTKNGESFWVHSTISPDESGGFLSCCQKVINSKNILFP